LIPVGKPPTLEKTIPIKQLPVQIGGLTNSRMVKWLTESNYCPRSAAADLQKRGHAEDQARLLESNKVQGNRMLKKLKIDLVLQVN
jgi:hypothetical protein